MQALRPHYFLPQMNGAKQEKLKNIYFGGRFGASS